MSRATDNPERRSMGPVRRPIGCCSAFFGLLLVAGIIGAVVHYWWQTLVALVVVYLLAGAVVRLSTLRRPEPLTDEQLAHGVATELGRAHGWTHVHVVPGGSVIGIDPAGRQRVLPPDRLRGA